jgi:adenylate kinase family enzyme
MPELMLTWTTVRHLEGESSPRKTPVASRMKRPTRHIHVVGASGSGQTTLGRRVAAQLNFEYLDSDDFYWLTTDPPYRHERELTSRRELLASELLRHERWILAGSICSWGDVFVEQYDMVVFLDTPTALRIDRLRQREWARYGPTRLEAGGDLHEQHEAFISWASSYDSGGLDIRSRQLHEAWLKRLPQGCAVLRLNGDRPIADLANDVARHSIP